jgi:hypothetical protein
LKRFALSALRLYAEQVSEILLSAMENFFKMAFKAYLGSFFALTVLMRSGISMLFIFFMESMKRFCCSSLKVVRVFKS